VRDPNFEMVKVLPDLVSHAVDFIDRQSGPFFLYLPLSAPHTPVVPSPAFKGKSQVGDYGDFVVQTDDALGQVMAALEHTGAAANTLLIFTSDNGSANLPFKEYSHNSNAPWRGRKSDIWDGGHRIPFLARWPGRIAANTACAEPICLNDLLATAAAVTGQKLAHNEGEDSYNILPALEGRKRSKPIREAVVHHSADGMFAIRQWPWKMVEGRGSGGWDGKGAPTDPPGQLYDLEQDPGEKNNLYAQRPEMVKRLTALLDKYRKSGRSRA
jgi:arylsulfatase A-like enzyme